VTFYTRQQQSLVERIERIAKIKMKKIGPPQPADIIKSSARDIAISLKEVNDSVLEHFNDIAEELIKEEGAERALSKALAFISGNTQKIPQRSILCSIEGYVTYILKCPVDYQSPGYIFSFLKKFTSERLTESIKGMRRLSKKAAVFDVAEDFKDEMEELVQKTQQGVEGVKGYEAVLVTSMGMLEDSDDEDERRGDESDEEVDDRAMHNAQRNKRDWEMFVGSLPNNADER
jgi:GGDEF domain-containing protein